ncbi:MAG: ABC transporter ATP-binding protein/permease, partial [Alphaproteobacteria bacterium]|nr:ABC transporter ATP-binding protein/permease [Alphaproteobacteria bacterium]
MEKGLYGFIWRYSKGYQLVITCVTIAFFPFLYFALELPKIIVNDALGSKPNAEAFPRTYFGIDFDNTEYLLTLCLLFLLVLIVNGGITMSLFIFKGITSERLLRRLRFQLFERIHRFPLKQFQKTSQGEVTSMITAEVEPFSQFFADAVELPLFQGGTMLTVLLFVFIQDPIMGIASIAIIPLQAYIIPKLQKKINLLAKERVVRIRGVAGRISEAVSGINDIHTHDTSAYSLTDFTHHLSGIFKVRMKIYQNKAFLKFLNNFLLKLTPLLFYSVGGVLILRGNLDIGQLVAVLGAYQQLMQPWKELLKYYQRMMDAKIKYQQVTEQFDPADMMPESLGIADRPETVPSLAGNVSLRNVSISDEDGVKSLDSITFDAAPGSRVAIVAGGSGRDNLAYILTRLIQPSQGRISIADQDFSNMHEAVIGRRIGYAGPDSYVFDGTIGYNVFYGLKHMPVVTPEDTPEREKDRNEAVSSGNVPHAIDAEWIDYGDAGVADNADLLRRWHETLRAVELEDFMYGRAMNMTINPETRGDLAAKIVQARQLILQKMQSDTQLADLIHPFDFEEYNVSATVGANLIFGEAIDAKFAVEHFGENEVIRSILDECELTNRFRDIGIQVAATLIDMFDGMSADEPIFEQYSFVDDDSLQELKRIATLAKRDGNDAISEEDTGRLISLTCQLVVERHRLGHINDDMQSRILEARRKFREQLAEDGSEAIAFFDPEEFNERLPLRSNLIMGRVNAGRPQAEEKVDQILRDVLDEMELTNEVILTAADFHVGIGGRRIPLAARQSIALVRSLIKRPEVLVINEALSAHDRETRDRIRRQLYVLLPTTTLIWIDSEMPDASEFDQVLVLRNGRIEERISEATPVEADTKAVDTSTVQDADGGTILNAEISALGQVPLFSEMDASRLKLL